MAICFHSCDERGGQTDVFLAGNPAAVISRKEGSKISAPISHMHKDRYLLLSCKFFCPLCSLAFNCACSTLRGPPPRRSDPWKVAQNEGVSFSVSVGEVRWPAIYPFRAVLMPLLRTLLLLVGMQRKSRTFFP